MKPNFTTFIFAFALLAFAVSYADQRQDRGTKTNRTGQGPAQAGKGAERPQRAPVQPRQGAAQGGGKASKPQRPSRAEPRTPSMSRSDVKENHPQARSNPPQKRPQAIQDAPQNKPQIRQNIPQKRPQVLPSVPKNPPDARPSAPKVHQPAGQNAQRKPTQVRPDAPQNHSQVRPNTPQPGNEALKNQARQFMRERKHQPSNLPGAGEKAPHEKPVFQELVKNNRNAAQNVSTHVRQNHAGYHKWFNSDRFKEHNFHSRYWHDNVNWWRGAPWDRVDGWLGWGISTYPIYYEVGGYPVEINNYDQQNYINTNVYQAYPSSAPAAEGEWLPLGVFALGADATQASYSNIFMQLAINQQGEIAGTYYNSATDQYYPIEGVVDQQSQEAYWKVSEGTFAPEMTTGIYNLTQDVVNVQLTFPEGTVQDWTMVRIADADNGS